MKFQSTAQAGKYQRHFWYGDSGCGKTKGIGDFHAAGQHVALVTTEIDGALPLRRAGLNVLQIIPSSYKDLVKCVTNPTAVIAEAKAAMPEFKDYDVKTWAFDGLRAIQRIILKEILAQPGKRQGGVGDEAIPSPTDYRGVDLRMRNLVVGIEHLPYHTIMTAHYEKDFDIDTHLAMTGDQRQDQDVPRKFQGYPSLEGYSLKYDLPGLVGSYYLYMVHQAGKYTFYTQNTQAGKARTRIAESVPLSVDWTSKNIYTYFQEKIG